MSALLAGPMVVGCSSSSTTTSAAADAVVAVLDTGGTASDADEGADLPAGNDDVASLGGDVAPEPEGCNALVDDAPGVAEQPGSGAPPARTGGALADGTYVLTERVDFTGGTCECTTHTKWVISNAGAALDAVTHIDDAPSTAIAAGLSVEGNILTISLTCPQAATLTFEYSTTGGTAIQLWDPLKQQLETYTKQ